MNEMDTYKGEPVIDAEYTEIPTEMDIVETLPEPLSMDERELAPVEEDEPLEDTEEPDNELVLAEYEYPPDESDNHDVAEYEFQPELVDELLDESEPLSSENCAACGEVLLPGKAQWKQVDGEWLPFGSTCVNDAKVQPQDDPQDFARPPQDPPNVPGYDFYERPENSMESTLATTYPNLARTNPQDSQDSQDGDCNCQAGGGNGSCVEVNIYNYGVININNQVSCG